MPQNRLLDADWNIKMLNVNTSELAQTIANIMRESAKEWIENGKAGTTIYYIQVGNSKGSTLKPEELFKIDIEHEKDEPRIAVIKSIDNKIQVKIGFVIYVLNTNDIQQTTSKKDVATQITSKVPQIVEAIKKVAKRLEGEGYIVHSAFVSPIVPLRAQKELERNQIACLNLNNVENIIMWIAGMLLETELYVFGEMLYEVVRDIAEFAYEAAMDKITSEETQNTTKEVKGESDIAQGSVNEKSGKTENADGYDAANGKKADRKVGGEEDHAIVIDIAEGQVKGGDLR